MSKDIDAFVKANLPTAQAVASKIGVDPMVILGQWGLETGWGKSVVPGTNNLGNIKGQGVAAKDNQTGSTDQYRAYPTLDAFGQDFGGLIQNRYKDAVNAGPDATAYAGALKKGGYAEDPAYATKLPAAVKAVRDSQGIDIDPSKIQWDAAPGKGGSAPDISPSIDASKIQWDAPAQESKAPAATKAEQPGVIESLGATAGKGFGKTVLGAQQLLGEGLKKVGADRAGTWLVNDAVQGAKNLNAQAAPYEDAHPVAGTIGEVTGAVVNPLNRLVPMGAGNSLISLMGRGASQGALSGALTPVQDGDNFWSDKARQTAIGGAIGGATPAAIAGVTAGTRYAANALRSLVDPLYGAGQERIAGNVLRKFAGSGPVTGNAAEIVQGSTPTLAQATGNAGLATLERGMQSATPQGANAFVEHAAQNAQARAGAFAQAAGTPADVATAEAVRNVRASQALNAAFSNAKPANPQPTVDAIDSILSGPSGKRDSVRAVLANIRSKLVDKEGRLETNPETLYNSVRKQIDDMLDSRMAMSNPAGLQASRELLSVRDLLDRNIDAAAPGFGKYLSDYAAESRPINAMQYLQGLKLTDAQDHITLAKVQNAITNISMQRGAPGSNDAKALSNAQLEVLRNLRDDLLRAGKSGLGKSIGSNTFQNLATNNILEQALPGPVNALLGGATGPVSNMVGRVGNWVYGGANENIQNKLLDMMLQPQSGLAALQNVRGNALAGQLGGNAFLQRVAPYLVPAGAVSGVNMVPGGK
ncbi:glycoside hydrolase family 73 protein [Cupriavidus metallidurans]|uniref:glycoside hydrolase family 73 protein n=1 Tax=Cupriavidus metallidurans TaxID=119219 RepID=UPI003CFFB942